MKKNAINVLILLALVASINLVCMEKKIIPGVQDKDLLQKYDNHWLSKVQEIGVVKNPRKARYCGENQIVISDWYGNCYSVNLKTQETQALFKKIASCDKGNQEAILQADGEKIMICQGSMISIYDGDKPQLKSYLLKTFDRNIASFAWNPLEYTVFLCDGGKSNKITRYNCITDEKKEISLLPSDQICEIMTMHPQKKIMCLADCLGNISLRNVDDTLSKIKKINLSNKLGSCWFCQYSPDGSRIIVGNNYKIFIIDPDANGDESLYIEAVGSGISCKRNNYTKGNYKEFIDIAFHLKNSILALLCRDTKRYHAHQLIRYYNIKTGHCIGELSEFNGNDSYNLCFSDNGFEGIVVLGNKCIRIHVPFAIKDRCIYSLYVLNQLKDQTHWPQDIVKYCGNILLETFKF